MRREHIIDAIRTGLAGLRSGVEVYTLADSYNMWEQRIAVVTKLTLKFCSGESIS